MAPAAVALRLKMGRTRATLLRAAERASSYFRVDSAAYK